MERNFCRRNWAWEYYYSNGSKYGRNKSHKNAWCSACLKSRLDALKGEDERKIWSGETVTRRSDEELSLQGLLSILLNSYQPKLKIQLNLATALNDTSPICGKIENLHTHLARCKYVDRRICHRAAMDRARTPRSPPGGHLAPAVPVADFSVEPALPSGDQALFEVLLCRTAASTGWSWNSLNDPEFVHLMRLLQPDLKVPDRRTLSGTILDQEVSRVVGDLKQIVEGRLATGMCDGWKNVSKTAVVASMITVDYQVCYCINVQ